MQHKVMNCRDWDGEQLGVGWISPKYDGVRGFIYPGMKHVMSRDFKPLYGLEHITKELKDFPYALDVELDIPGMEFNKKSGIIRSYSSSPNVIALVIDTPGLEDIIENRLDARPKISDLIIPIHHEIGGHIEAEELYKFAIHEGLEGIVWKPERSIYRNTRGIWIRRVPVHSVDCMCVDVYEGKGKLEGVAGGIYIMFRGMKCKVGTMKGIDFDERAEMWMYSERYIGRTAIVEYKELQPSGKPRQPRFKGWRYDKEADA